MFESENHFMDFLRKSSFDKNEKIVFVIRNQGPKGGPGMPEMLKPTSAIVGMGLKDNVAFITDGRFSGGSHGFIVGHVSPEAREGGPIGKIMNGDIVTIDTKNNQINWEENIFTKKIHVSIPIKQEKIEEEKSIYLKKYIKLVSGSENGCITF